jgi:tetratricopeptide (TPR) repeat protein
MAQSLKSIIVPARHQNFQKIDYFAALVSATLAFLIYWLTLGPTVTGEDSGELVTAAYTMGIAHPPGYPLWCILGKGFTLFPFGDVAWRVNLMSAVFASLTVGIICLIAIHITRNRIASVAGALAFAFSREFWEQSVIAEVYSLNAFFVALCTLLLLRWNESRDRRLLFAFALALGLSLGNHNTMQVLAPVFALFILAVDRRPWLRWKQYTLAGLCAVLPLAVYLYLPLRSATNPPMDWGNPETLQGFMDVVLRRQYTFMFTENPRSIGLFQQQCWAFLSLYVQEFTPWLAWVPLIGAVALWRRSRAATALLLGIGGAVLFSVILVNNFSIEREAIWVNNVFWIPVYMVVGILIGGAVDGLMRVKFVGLRREVGVATVVLVVASLLAWNWRHNDKSQYFFAHDFATNVFASMEPNAIYFPTADHATFPCIYLQAVEGARPDISIANKYGYPEESIYSDMPAEQRARFKKIPSDAEERIIEDWVIQNYKDRPVYFTKKRTLDSVPGARMVSAGLLYRVLRENETQPERDFFAEYKWHDVDKRANTRELTASMVLSDIQYARARNWFEKGDAKQALDAIHGAIEIGGESKESLNNAGSLCAENSQWEAAEKYYVSALAFDPEYEFTVRNLGKVYMQTGKHKAALPYFEQVLRKDPLDPEANWLAYESLKGQLRYDEAFAQLKRMATFPYEDARVYRELGMHYMNNESRPKVAVQMLAKSLQLDPNQPDIERTIAQLQQAPGQTSEPNPLLPESLVPRPQMPLNPSPQIPSPNAVIPNPRAPGGLGS